MTILHKINKALPIYKNMDVTSKIFLCCVPTFAECRLPKFRSFSHGSTSSHVVGIAINKITPINRFVKVYSTLGR